VAEISPVADTWVRIEWVREEHGEASQPEEEEEVREVVLLVV
jgi:hypothetical protein